MTGIERKAHIGWPLAKSWILRLLIVLPFSVSASSLRQRRSIGLAQATPSGNGTSAATNTTAANTTVATNTSDNSSLQNIIQNGLVDNKISTLYWAEVDRAITAAAFVTPKPHSVNDPGPTPTPDPYSAILDVSTESDPSALGAGTIFGASSDSAAQGLSGYANYELVLGPPVPPVPSVPSVPSGLPEVAMQLASAVDEAEVISVEDEEPQPEASLREAVPSLREAAPSLTSGESMHQIVEIDPEECQQAESIPKEQHLREPAGPPAQVMPLAEAETVMEGFGGLGGSAQVDQFGPQARAAFRPPRGREAETAEAPTLQGQPFAMAPVVPAAFQGCDGSLLGPAARHQFKKPRVLATPARAVSSFNPIGEGATTLNAAAPKLPQSTAGLICSAADLLRAHREHREHRV